MAGLAKPKAAPVDKSIAITIAVRKLARSGRKVALNDEARLQSLQWSSLDTRKESCARSRALSLWPWLDFVAPQTWWMWSLCQRPPVAIYTVGRTWGEAACNFRSLVPVAVLDRNSFKVPAMFKDDVESPA